MNIDPIRNCKLIATLRRTEADFDRATFTMLCDKYLVDPNSVNTVFIARDTDELRTISENHFVEAVMFFADGTLRQFGDGSYSCDNPDEMFASLTLSRKLF